MKHRSFKNGRMLVTELGAGDTDFEDFLPRDGATSGFVAGDARATEQPGLTMMHTIFLRLHNYVAAMLIEDVCNKSPPLDARTIDELTYQHSRRMVAAIIQKITFKDWLPTLFGETAVNKYIGKYYDYNETESGDLCEIFYAAAFRFGHSMLPQKLALRDADCNKVSDWPQDLALRDAYFKPTLWTNNGVDDFMELLVNGFACTLASEVDTRVTDAVRNFLFKGYVYLRVI